MRTSAEKPPIWHSLSNMADVEKTLIGIAASSGLVMAACLSGLPSTTCTALAEAYGRAIVSFGAAALLPLALVVGGIFLPRSRWGFAVAAGIFFLVNVFVAAQNLALSVKHCFIAGSEAELASRLHSRIELLDIVHPERWHRERWSAP